MINYDKLSLTIKSYIQSISDELDTNIIAYEYDLIYKEISTIRLSFESIVDNIIINISDKYENKFQYVLTDIDVTYNNLTIKLLCSNQILNLEQSIIDYLQLKSIESNLIKSIRADFDKSEDKFNSERKLYLSKSLSDIQLDVLTEHIPYTYKDALQSYNRSIRLYNELIAADNDVYILDLSSYIKQLKNNENRDMKISKYVYLVNNHNIHIIYTKDEFTNKHGDILYLLDKITDNQTLNYYIQKAIIDKLFNDVLKYNR